ncbi:glycosyltransferase family 2 protein [Microbaculum marinum]|uniref:Glycosyltransferase family 2 protein n=1 Tax=Microbaculum marinum TaxID=1764581 RepID=A0AAW9RVD1_9HYPH
MRLSVVTVCLNAAGSIAHTLDSFFAQRHPDKEIVVVDGGSSDGTLQILDRYACPDLTVVTGPDRGLYDAMNKGLARFDGDAVGFLNADDRFHDAEALGVLAEGLAKADIVFGNVDFVAGHESGRVVRQWRGSSFRHGHFGRGWMPAHPTFHVRRAVADAVGSFDLGYPIAADYDWMLRACELHEFSTAYLDRVLVDMSMGGRSTRDIRSYAQHNLEALRARRAWLGSGVVDAALLAKPLRKLSQFMVR